MSSLIEVVFCIAVIPWVWWFPVARTWRGSPKSAYVRNPESAPPWYPFGDALWRVHARSIVFAGLLLTVIAAGTVLRDVEPATNHAVRVGVIVGAIVAFTGVATTGLIAQPKAAIPPPFRYQRGILSRWRV
jgi:hypothetical protein